MVVGGFMALSYVLNVVAGLVEKANDVKYVSLFYYFDSSKALIKNEFDLTAHLVFLTIAIVTTLLGAVIFKKRDI